MSYVDLDQNTFDQKIKAGKGVALVDFWSPSCVPCVMQGPIVEEVADALDGEVLVGKLNIDDNMSIAQDYGVMSIPTLVVFKDGKEQKRLVGVQSKEALLDMVRV